MTEGSKFPFGLVESVLKAIAKVFALPFAGLAKRLRARRNVYEAFWTWSSEQSEEIKLGAYDSKPYVISRLLESGFDLNYQYDRLREMEKQYVHRLPKGLRKRLDSLIRILKPVVHKYGDAHDQMYGSTKHRLSASSALQASAEVGTAIVDFRDYCKKKLNSLIYRSLG